MKISSNILLKQLEGSVQEQIIFVNGLKNLDDKTLNYRIQNDSWSILECIKHLNLYSAFYNPAISRAIENGSRQSVNTFSSGWLGNYFAESMFPKVNNKKMQTFRSMNPIHSSLSRHVLDEYIHYQTEMLVLLEKSYDINIQTTRTPITISKYIKLRLGDTFRFVINHNTRHILQIKNILNTINKFS